MLLNINTLFWGAPGLFMMVVGMYQTYHCSMREAALGATIVLFYIGLILPKKSIRAHVNYIRETESTTFDLFHFTTKPLFIIWFSIMTLLVIAFIFLNHDSILYLSFLNITSLFFMTYSGRYVSSFYVDPGNLIK